MMLARAAMTPRTDSDTHTLREVTLLMCQLLSVFVCSPFAPPRTPACRLPPRSLAGRHARPMGRTYACRRHNKLQRQAALSGGHEQAPPSRAIHAARCRHDRLSPDGDRSRDVFAAVDAGERLAESDGTDVRDGVPRRQLQSRRDSLWSTRRRTADTLSRWRPLLHST